MAKKTRSSKKRRLKLPSRATTLIFAVGLFLIGSFIFYSYTHLWRLSFWSEPEMTEYRIEDSYKLPDQITIDRLNIDTAVIDTRIIAGRWMISKDSASHLINSAKPGERGNIIIYAHNSRNLFGPLIGAREGDIVNITTRDGQIFSYKIVTVKTVRPNDVSVLESDGTEVLTIYTCTGFADTKRLVVQAKPL